MAIKRIMMKTKKDIWTLSANYLSKEMEELEMQSFEEQLENDHQLAEEFRKIKLSWDNLGNNKPINTGKAWRSLLTRIEDDNLLVKEDKEKIHLYQQIGRIAAIFVFALLVTFSLYYIFSSNNYKIGTEHILEARNSVRSYTLPEGSRVFLNQGAKLHYTESFNQERKVLLEGEAFFEVMSDIEKPFTISTSDAEITVLGTRFNVKENHQQKFTEVYVESGKVKLSSGLNPEGLILEKGDFANTNGGSESIVNQENINYLAWKTREFQFVNKELENVFEVLRNSYHVDIQVMNPEINEFKITTVYSQQSIDAILNTISRAFNLDYRSEKGIYYLSTKE